MKGSKELQYKHWFTNDNGIIYWDKPDLLKAKIDLTKNKRGYAIITTAKEDPTPNQYAFYFGGIIRGECMHSNIFQGLNEKEIHQILFKELRSYKRGRTVLLKSGEELEIMEDFVEDFDDYDKDKMRKYIEELIPYLANEYGIYIKDSKEYSLKNSHIKSKEK